MVFNVVMFVFGFLVLALQPLMPLNPEGKGMLAPTTIFNTLASFMTNTNLQHYSGDQHLSYFSQSVFIVWNMFVSASVGFCALLAIIRLLRSDKHVGNYFVDMFRIVTYTFIPAAFIMGIVFMHDGIPMTFHNVAEVQTLEAGAMGTGDDGQPKPQLIARGPVAAVLPIKHLGTNGGGFFGANSAHPFENPSATSNFLECMNMVLFPFSLVIMFGVMLKKMRHAAVVFGVMMTMFLGMIGWAVYWDTMHPNPGLTSHAAATYQLPDATAPDGSRELTVPAVAGLPVDQELGNLEGKELRFGTSAGATFSAFTTAITCGSVNCMHDSLTPLAGITPLVGMWINCVFGGKGVGMINMLVFIIIGIFLAGQMVGRTPEYLGKKVGATEMKLVMLALLVHPILILGPTGVFAATDWGIKAANNPAAHAYSEILYEFSSSSANNGSGFEGLGDTYGFNSNPAPAPYSPQWDIATGLVMLFGRFLPMLAPLAMAAALGRKKSAPFTLGTMRTDTLTFACLLLGTVIIINGLLFLPVAALGPLAEHWGPMPFGG
jgi:K+-transporting ATPase ATPase A chain